MTGVSVDRRSRLRPIPSPRPITSGIRRRYYHCRYLSRINRYPSCRRRRKDPGPGYNPPSPTRVRRYRENTASTAAVMAPRSRWTREGDARQSANWRFRWSMRYSYRSITFCRRTAGRSVGSAGVAPRSAESRSGPARRSCAGVSEVAVSFVGPSVLSVQSQPSRPVTLSTGRSDLIGQRPIPTRARSIRLRQTAGSREYRFWKPGRPGGIAPSVPGPHGATNGPAWPPDRPVHGSLRRRGQPTPRPVHHLGFFRKPMPR